MPASAASLTMVLRQLSGVLAAHPLLTSYGPHSKALRFGRGAILLCMHAAAEDDTAEGEGAASRAQPHCSVVARTHSYDTEASVPQPCC